MKTKEFGELILIKDEYPMGIVLREDLGGVVLEEYFDTDWKSKIILHVFAQGVTLDERECFYDCIVKARNYEPNLKVPIYVKFSDESPYNKRDESDEEKKACFACITKWVGTEPWKMFGCEICEKCKNGKGDSK